jgi:hypothetical protein
MHKLHGFPLLKRVFSPAHQVLWLTSCCTVSWEALNREVSGRRPLVLTRNQRDLCCSGLWYRVDLSVDASVSEKHTLSIFRAKVAVLESGVVIWG